MRKVILEDIEFILKNLQENIFRMKKNDKGEIVYILNEGPIPRKLNIRTNVVYGKTIEELVGKEKADEVLPYFVEAFTGKVTSYELKLGEFIFQTVLSPVEIEGEILEVSGTSFDITEKRQQEKELIEAHKKLKQLNETKDKLFSIIAHDLKSPFSSLMGFSQLLVKEIQEKKFDNVAEYAQIILDVTTQSLTLLNNLLEWSLTQTGNLAFNPEKINIAKLSNKLITYFNNFAQSKQITIFSTINSDLKLFGDRNMLTTIFRNLLSNAIKYTPKGGEITISATEDINETIISIKDTGVGIESDDLKNLFKLEESKSTLGTNNEKGTGLGLILCKNFIEKHNGKIWVESKVEKGSIFNFIIPKILT